MGDPERLPEQLQRPRPVEEIDGQVSPGPLRVRLAARDRDDVPIVERVQVLEEVAPDHARRPDDQRTLPFSHGPFPSL